jgi:hypothetical protein
MLSSALGYLAQRSPDFASKAGAKYEASWLVMQDSSQPECSHSEVPSPCPLPRVGGWQLYVSLKEQVRTLERRGSCGRQIKCGRSTAMTISVIVWKHCRWKSANLASKW